MPPGPGADFYKNACQHHNLGPEVAGPAGVPGAVARQLEGRRAAGAAREGSVAACEQAQLARKRLLEAPAPDLRATCC